MGKMNDTSVWFGPNAAVYQTPSNPFSTLQSVPASASVAVSTSASTATSASAPTAATAAVNPSVATPAREAAIALLAAIALASAASATPTAPVKEFGLVESPVEGVDYFVYPIPVVIPPPPVKKTVDGAMEASHDFVDPVLFLEALENDMQQLPDLWHCSCRLNSDLDPAVLDVHLQFMDVPGAMPPLVQVAVILAKEEGEAHGAEVNACREILRTCTHMTVSRVADGTPLMSIDRNSRVCTFAPLASDEDNPRQLPVCLVAQEVDGKPSTFTLYLDTMTRGKPDLSVKS